MKEVTDVKMNASQGTCSGSLHAKRLLYRPKQHGHCSKAEQVPAALSWRLQEQGAQWWWTWLEELFPACLPSSSRGSCLDTGGSTLQTDTRRRLHEPRGIRSPVRARKLRQLLQQTAAPQRAGILDWPCSLQQRQREPNAKLWHHLPSGRLGMPVSRPFLVEEGEEQCLVQGQDPRDTITAHPGFTLASPLWP